MSPLRANCVPIWGRLCAIVETYEQPSELLSADGAIHVPNFKQWLVLRASVRHHCEWPKLQVCLHAILQVRRPRPAPIGVRGAAEVRGGPFSLKSQIFDRFWPCFAIVTERYIKMFSEWHKLPEMSSKLFLYSLSWKFLLPTASKEGFTSQTADIRELSLEFVLSVSVPLVYGRQMCNVMQTIAKFWHNTLYSFFFWISGDKIAHLVGVWCPISHGHFPPWRSVWSTDFDGAPCPRWLSLSVKLRVLSLSALVVVLFKEIPA